MRTFLTITILAALVLMASPAFGTDAGVGTAIPETLSAVPATAVATAVTTATATPDGPVGPQTDVIGTGSLAFQLLMAKEYKPFAGMLLMLLLALLRSFWSMVPAGLRPSAVVLSGAVAATATGLLAGVGTAEAIWNGVALAGVAAAVYEMARPLLSRLPGKAGALFQKRNGSPEPEPAADESTDESE